MSNGIAWARATPAEPRVEASAATRKAERNVRIGLSLLQKLRRALGTVHGDVAGRAVLISRQRDVVERRRLRAQSPRRERRVTLETLRGDRRPLQLVGIRGAMWNVAARAVAGDAVDVREDERTAHLRVAGDAAWFAASRLLHRVLGRAAVRVVAGHAGKRALLQPVRVRKRPEGRGRVLVAGRAQLRGLGHEQAGLLRVGLVDGMAGEAVDRLGRRVHARLEGRALGGLLVAGRAYRGAGTAPKADDEGLVPLGLHVLRPVAVAGGADRVATRAAVGGAVAAHVGITLEELGLVVAVGARGAGLHLRGSRTGWSLGHRAPRREYGEGSGGVSPVREVFHGLYSSARVDDVDSVCGTGPVAGPAGLGRDRRGAREVRRVDEDVCGNVAAVVAARAGRRGRAARREEVALCDDGLVRDRERQRVRRGRRVAGEAVPAVAGVCHVVKGRHGSAEPVDRVVLGERVARVDAVDHAGEADRLGWVRRGRTHRRVVAVRVVTDDAVLDRDALVAVREEAVESRVADVALRELDDRPARHDRRARDGEGERLGRGALVLRRRALRRGRIQRVGTARLDGRRPCARGRRRDGVREGVGRDARRRVVRRVRGHRRFTDGLATRDASVQVVQRVATQDDAETAVRRDLEIARVDERAVAVRERVRDRDLLAWARVREGEDLGRVALELRRQERNDVGVLDAGVPLDVALGLVAGGARPVGRGAGRMVRARREVQVVVAGAAGRDRRVRVPVAAAGGRRVVAGRAEADVLRVGDRADGRVLPLVQGMEEDLAVEVRVRPRHIVRVMAEHAGLDVDVVAAVLRERVVALVAAGDRHRVERRRGRARGRDVVLVGGRRIVVLPYDVGRVPDRAHVHRHGLSVVERREGGGERVLVVAGLEVLEGARRVTARAAPRHEEVRVPAGRSGPPRGRGGGGARGGGATTG